MILVTPEKAVMLSVLVMEDAKMTSVAATPLKGGEVLSVRYQGVLEVTARTVLDMVHVIVVITSVFVTQVRTLILLNSTKYKIALSEYYFWV